MSKYIRFLTHAILPILTFCLAIALSLLSAPPASATGVYQIPPLSGGSQTWIIDDADVISRANEGKLNSQLSKLAQDTNSEVRLVTIRRLDYGETIDSFTNQLFEKWFSTPEAQANQVLIVLDTLTNDSAIRTGEAIKPLLSEEIATSIASETILFPLKEGEKYNQAFLDASDRISLVLSGQPDPGAPSLKEVNTEGNFASKEETKNSNATVWVIALLIAATVIPMVTYFALYQN